MTEKTEPISRPMNVQAAARELDVSTTTIYNWLENGRLESFPVTGPVLVTPESVATVKVELQAEAAAHAAG